MKKNTVTIELPYEVISRIAAQSAFEDKYSWDLFVKTCKQALDTQSHNVFSDMLSEINNLNNALINTYAILSGNNREDLFKKVLNKEDFKVLTVAKAEEVIRTVTGGRVKKGK